MLKLLLTMVHAPLREKDLAKLRHIQGIKIRLSVDGWGPRRIYKAGYSMGRETSCNGLKIIKSLVYRFLI